MENSRDVLIIFEPKLGTSRRSIDAEVPLVMKYTSVAGI